LFFILFFSLFFLLLSSFYIIIYSLFFLKLNLYYQNNIFFFFIWNFLYQIKSLLTYKNWCSSYNSFYIKNHFLFISHMFNYPPFSRNLVNTLLELIFNVKFYLKHNYLLQKTSLKVKKKKQKTKNKNIIQPKIGHT